MLIGPLHSAGSSQLYPPSHKSQSITGFVCVCGGGGGGGRGGGGGHMEYAC